MLREHVVKRRKLSPPEEDSGRTSVPGFAKWDIEQDYEQRPRKGKKDEKHKRLPIKTVDGWRERTPSPEIAKDDEDGDSFPMSDDGSDSGVAGLQQPKPQEPKQSQREEIMQAKEELARMAALISEGPEEHIGLLSPLAQIADTKNSTVKKLALATQLAVYKDVIPGYRIRPLSKEDQQVKVGKDVKKLRSFEQALVHGYKGYVHMLGRIAKSSKSDGVATVAVSCACTLLTDVPHFNLRNDIIAIIVLKLAGRTVGQDFVRCREALEQLFREDEDGNASLEVVSQLTKMMKGKNYRIHEDVLNAFLHLRLLSEFSHKSSLNRVDKPKDEIKSSKDLKLKREFRTKRERKVLKERNVVAKELKEADAVLGHEERDKNQSEMLKMVFVTYFRILKARIPSLMGAVLEGLARYAHLINQDFFGDILEALKDLINDAEASLEEDEESEEGVEEDAQRNATRESLLCITTAFALLQGQDVAKSANALHLDLNFFITHLYRTLLSSSLNPDIELSAKTAHLKDPNGLQTPATRDTRINVATTSVLLLRSLQSVLLPPTSTKAVPPTRVAAFTKQLLISSLQLPQRSCLALLSLLQQIAKTHHSKISALWNTEERKGDGVFDALSDEVEASNPFAATVWEGELLRCHFDPHVREAVKAVERNIMDRG